MFSTTIFLLFFGIICLADQWLSFLVDQRDRHIGIDEFRHGNKDVLVATDVASKGLDFQVNLLVCRLTDFLYRFTWSCYGFIGFRVPSSMDGFSYVLVSSAIIPTFVT